MKRICFFFIIISANVSLFAQNFSQEIICSHDLEPYEYDIAKANNSYLVGISAFDSIVMKKSVVFFKTDTSGIIQYSFNYQGDTLFNSISCGNIFKQNNQYFVSGRCNNGYSYNGNPYIMALDSNGNVNWAKYLNLSIANLSGVHFETLSDNSILGIVVSDDSAYNYNMHFFKIDSTGNMSDFYLMQDYNGDAMGVITKNGSFDIMFLNGNIANISNDLQNVNWQTKIENEYAAAMAKAINGDYLIATTQTPYPACINVMRMDSNRNILWNKKFELWEQHTMQSFDISQISFISNLDNNRIMLSGKGDIIQDGSVQLVIDDNGNHVSSIKTFTYYDHFITPVVNDVVYGGFVDLTPQVNNGSFIFSRHPFHNPFDCIDTLVCSVTNNTLSLLTPDTINLISDTTVTSHNMSINVFNANITQSNYCSIVSVKELDYNDISIYPNPNNGTFNIDIGELKDVSIQVFDSFGQIIMQNNNVDEDKIEININSAAGIYFVKVSTEGRFAVYKIIKE